MWKLILGTKKVNCYCNVFFTTNKVIKVNTNGQTVKHKKTERRDSY